MEQQAATFNQFNKEDQELYDMRFLPREELEALDRPKLEKITKLCKLHWKGAKKQEMIDTLVNAATAGKNPSQ